MVPTFFTDPISAYVEKILTADHNRGVRPSFFMDEKSKVKVVIFSIFAKVFTFLMIPQYKVNKMKIICAEYLSISENFPDIQTKLAEKVYKIVILNRKQV